VTEEKQWLDIQWSSLETAEKQGLHASIYPEVFVGMTM